MMLRLALDATPPFHLGLTVWCLRRRSHNTVDRWDGETYRRVLLVDRMPIEVAVRQTGLPRKPVIEVLCDGKRIPPWAKVAISSVLRRTLGMDRDLRDFYRMARKDPHLAPMACRLEGMKPPRFPSIFEALANAIACQQVSLTAGLHVLNRLAETFGASHQDESGTAHAFPEPRDLKGVEPDELRKLGFSRQKARALLDLASACASGNAGPLDGLEDLDDAATAARLCKLGGVGRWTAEYALLRGLGRLNVFPADDIGGQNKLRSWLKIRGGLDYDTVRRRLQRWYPYQGLIYFHLLVSGLAEQNLLT